MAAPTIPISVDSFEGSFGDTIDIDVDVIHPVPVALVVFPAATVVLTLAQHGEAIRGIQGHLLEVPIQEKLRALRDKVDVVDAESASLRATIRTMGVVKTILHNRIRGERQTRIEIERQLASSPEAAPQSPEQAPPSPDYVPGPEYPEYLASSDDEIPVEDQPLPADVSPTALSPGYVANSDPLEEDHEEDPANEGDNKEEEEESSGDDEEEEEEASEEDEHEEEEHLALADFVALPAIDPVPSAEETEHFKTDESVATPPPPCTIAYIVEYTAAPTPPSPSPLTSYSSPLPQIPSPSLHVPSLPLPIPSLPLLVPSPPFLLPFADHRSDIPDDDMPSRKKVRLTAPASRFEVGESSTAAAARQIGHTLARRVDYGFIDTLDANLLTDERERQRIDDGDRLMSHIQHDHDKFKELARTRDIEHQDRPADASSSSRSVVDALAKYEANKNSRNEDDSHESGSGERRTVSTTHECTYSDILKCPPLNFKGTKGVIGLNQCALTWWNSHVKTIGHDASYGMPWKTMKKMITAKYCPRSEIKKLEIEIWNRKESDEVEKYVGGLPNMIQGSVMASKLKTMQEAIEFTNELMD
ncbi:hypothetical protein Tco_1315544 [Tanacetum coccineum]